VESRDSAIVHARAAIDNTPFRGAPAMQSHCTLPTHWGREQIVPVSKPCPSDLEHIEKASQDELRTLQLQRLKESVKRAYLAVPHYRQRFKQAGVHPHDLRSLDDLARFPFTYKDDLRENYPFGMFAVPRERIVRLHASSGTTGKATVVGYTAKDIDTWASLMARSIRAAGGRPGDIVHVAYGYGLFTGGLGAHYGAERLGCTVVPMSGGQTEKQVQLIGDFQPDIIMVTPSYMLAIAEQFARQGLDAAACSLRVGIFGAEPWTEAMRAQIESAIGIDALDIYGLSEVMGPGVASECIESKDGAVLWEDHFYPEIIDPESGRVLPDGELGELVLTSLTKEALPVIRYRTRDLTRLLPPTARSMRRMARIVGRSDDMLIVRGVNVFPSQIEALILQIPALAPHYQIELTRDGQLDALTIRVEGATSLDRTVLAQTRDLLARHVKSYVGISVGVQIVPPGSIERSLGKAKRVLDRRAPIGAADMLRPNLRCVD
jgi:phenylacetate-CoA ligase